MPFDPFDLPAAHVFKVGADGLVHETEAMGFTAPYDSPTGWERIPSRTESDHLATLEQR